MATMYQILRKISSTKADLASIKQMNMEVEPEYEVDQENRKHST